MAFNKNNGINGSRRFIIAMTAISAILLVIPKAAHCQTFAEWFDQKRTQRKYLVQQIAALQVYSRYLRKGYTIAKQGLGSVSGNLLRENGLHAAYYNSLEKVKPSVAHDDCIREIVQWQQDILKLWTTTDHLNTLNEGEQAYLEKVKAAELSDCGSILNTLQQVISDGKVKMSDAERIKLIQKLYDQMEDNFRFATSFTFQVRLYAAQRQQEGKNNMVIKGMYQLH